ncbi:MAG: hypothetical protein KF912_05640 [Phycisphaeraceae bacterium]|nr:hypothetical protein [Phycisphaeraceae bacterium]MBX3366781.1 hypothetical protein [Phycisphaeraceae bacterium]
MSAETPKSEEKAAKKKGLPLPIVVGALMAVEGIAVFAAVKMMSAPAKSEASEIDGGHAAAEAALVELRLVEDRFQNMQTGRVWLWDVEIFLKVKAKHEDHVAFVLQARSAEIKEGVSMLFRRASHAQLKEPGLETMNRQLTAYMAEVMGTDPNGDPYIARVLIPRCKGMQID